MGAKSTNVTSKQMLPLFQVISDLEKPGGSTTSLQTNNNSSFYFENTSVLGSDDIIVHKYSQPGINSKELFRNLDGSVSDGGIVPLDPGKYRVDGIYSKKGTVKRRYKKRRRKMDQKLEDGDFQFKGKKVSEKHRHHRHKESDTHSKTHKHTSKKHKEEQITDASSHTHSLKGNQRRTGLFTEMGLSNYKDEGIDISRHFKNLTKGEIHSETDNLTVVDHSDCPTYEVPKDLITRNVNELRRRLDRSDNNGDVTVENFEDSEGRTVRLTRTSSKMSSKNIVKNYEDMLATLLAKCVQKDILMQQKDGHISKLKSKMKDLLSCNTQFADENDFLKRQHEDMKLCLEQHKSCLSSVEDQLQKLRSEKDQGGSSGLCANCSSNEITAIKVGRLNTQLMEDLVMLKNVVYRLNVQLLRYQDKLRGAQPHTPNKASDRSRFPPSDTPIHHRRDGVDSSKADPEIKIADGISIPSLPTFVLDSDNHTDLSQRLEAAEQRLHFAEKMQRTYSVENEEQTVWGDVNTHTLAPLLNAYQESIVEKDLLIRDYESEFNRFTAKLKQVVEENDTMHLSSSKMATELAEHRGKSGMAIAERDTLRRECVELKEKVMQLGGKLKEVHELYEQKVEAMSRDYNMIHEEYFKCKTSLAATQSRCQVFEDQRKGQQTTIPANVYNNTVQECKRLFDELKSRYEADKGRLTSRLSVLQESNEHMERKVMELSCEKHKVETKAKNGDKLVRKCRKEVATLRSELAATKAARDSAVRRSGHATNLCRQLATEVQRGATGAQGAAGAQGATPQQARAEKLLVQKEAMKELEAVESLMREQDRSLDAVKKKSISKISSLEDMLRESHATVEAMRQHINKERLHKYGASTSTLVQNIPEEVVKGRMLSRDIEEGVKSRGYHSSHIVPAKGGFLIQRDSRSRKSDDKHTPN